jgi:hypothetical protein
LPQAYNKKQSYGSEFTLIHLVDQLWTVNLQPWSSLNIILFYKNSVVILCIIILWYFDVWRWLKIWSIYTSLFLWPCAGMGTNHFYQVAYSSKIREVYRVPCLANLSGP